MIDQDRFRDLTLLEAPLLNIIIEQADPKNRAPTLACILETPDPRLTAIRIEELLELDAESLLSQLSLQLDAWKYFVRTVGCSSFLFSTIKRSFELMKRVFLARGFEVTKTLIEKEMELRDRLFREESSSPVDLHRELRRYKEEEFLRIGCRDLAGIADVVEVMAELSDLAMASLEITLDHSFKRLVMKHGSPSGYLLHLKAW